MAKSVYDLASGLVLDRSTFVGLPPIQMLGSIEAIRAAQGKALHVVDSADDFFTHKTLFNFIQNGDPKFALVNEGMGNFLSQEQVNALLGVKPLAPVKFPIADQVEVQAPHDDDGVVINMAPVPGYTLAPVPAGWSVNDNMSLGPTKIKRKKKNSDGDGTMFYMHPDSFFKLWGHASRIWAGEANLPALKFDTGVGIKSASLWDDRISLGGNYIRRYEIEQVAKHRGWAFPNGAKIAA